MDMLIWYQVVADRKDITLNRAPLSGIGRKEAPFSWPRIRVLKTNSKEVVMVGQ